ncbi:hypothetical protein PM082_014009 [Marasmius tenuissimus]|nr:hypothetical protein PM082_014009 [Marasmius tenuissimus]
MEPWEDTASPLTRSTGTGGAPGRSPLNQLGRFLGTFFRNGCPPPTTLTRLIKIESFDYVASLINRTKGQVVFVGGTVREERSTARTIMSYLVGCVSGREDIFVPVILTMPVEKWGDGVECHERLETLRAHNVFEG